MPDANQTYDKEQVNFWVEPKQKQRWQEFLEEESQFQHLSQLARQAVEREIKQSTDTTDSVELSENVVAHFDDLQGSIDQLGQVLQEVESRLSGLEREVRDDPRVRQLANEVYETLPTKGDIKEYEEAVGNGATLREIGATRVDSGRVEPIAEQLDARESEVRAALDRLQEDTHQVHSMEWAGESRYYKEA